MGSCGTIGAKRGRGQEASLGAFMGCLGRPIGGLREAFLRPPGASLGPLGGSLGASWGVLGGSWGFPGSPRDL